MEGPIVYHQFSLLYSPTHENGVEDMGRILVQLFFPHPAITGEKYFTPELFFVLHGLVAAAQA